MKQQIVRIERRNWAHNLEEIVIKRFNRDSVSYHPTFSSSWRIAHAVNRQEQINPTSRLSVYHNGWEWHRF